MEIIRSGESSKLKALKEDSVWAEGCCTGFINVNREALCQVLKMYDEGGKLLNGIKTM